jgi:UDP-N-acetylglucosamine transferase subunit ALG13
VIFVTVGTQLAFDRLISAVDVWAGLHPDERVFAQIGPSALVPESMEHAAFLPPTRADMLMREADIIVAHAGMGSVLTALALPKPIVIVPRRASLGEHRNDHQLATARWLEGRPGVFVAWDESDVAGLLDDRGQINGSEPISPVASGPLVDRLADVISKAVRPT